MGVPLTLKQRDESSLLCLEGTVDIACAAELKALLIEGLSGAKPVRVSIEKAASLDVTAVQLLWAAARESRAAGVELTLDGPVRWAAWDCASFRLRWGSVKSAGWVRCQPQAASISSGTAFARKRAMFSWTWSRLCLN
jgi:ABC-type transporter Mla MlaB component